MEVDKGCPMITMDESGWMFLLVPATRVVPDKRLLNSRVCVFYDTLVKVGGVAQW